MYKVVIIQMGDSGDGFDKGTWEQAEHMIVLGARSRSAKTQRY